MEASQHVGSSVVAAMAHPSMWDSLFLQERPIPMCGIFRSCSNGSSQLVGSSISVAMAHPSLRDEPFP